MSSIIYVYLQSLGELGSDGYDDHPLGIYFWGYFFFSTVFLQITLLNLIIAIMGDTFDKVMEIRQEAKLKEICAFIAEYFYMFPENEVLENSLMLVAAIDQGESAVTSSWEGKIGNLKKAFKGQMSQLETRVIKMNEHLHYEAEKIQKGLQELKTQADENQHEHKEREKQVNANHEEISNILAETRENNQKIKGQLRRLRELVAQKQLI